jgi:hypothetical protein
MRSYRCYFLDDRDMISLAEIIEAVSDADALKIAAERLAKQPAALAVEIWHLTRLVDRLTRGAAAG